MPEDYVDQIQDNKLRLRFASSKVAEYLRDHDDASLVEEHDANDWVIKFTDQEELGVLIQALDELGVAFVGGPAGWPPAEVVADIRERGFFTGSYKEILWKSPGNWFIRDR